MAGQPIRELSPEPMIFDGDEMHIPRIEHPLWGELWAPDHLPELVAIAAADTWGPDLLEGWRGQSCIDWGLHSGAVRRLERPDPISGRSPGEVTEERMQRYEARLLEEARLAGHGHVGGRRLSDLQLMAILQHHGAATRLLDFTENVLVATWFACQAHPREHGLLVGIDRFMGNSWQLEREQDIELPFERLIERAERKLVHWKPYALSQRMPVQSAFHVWSEVVMHDWGSLASGAEDHPATYETSQITGELAYEAE